MIDGMRLIKVASLRHNSARSCRKRMNFIKILLEALIYIMILIIPFAWIMRDGLGPGSTTSSGFNAISKCFMTFYSGPILIGLLALSFWVKKKKGPDK